MTSSRFDVTAVGNAIVDIIGRCDDAFLAKHNAPKGHMRLVDAETLSTLYSNMGPGTESSGGSAANTVAGIVSFGGRTAFIGRVADDAFGKIFRHDITAAGVSFTTPAVSGGQPTSSSLILVTPDGERTMNTFLGVSTNIEDRDIDPDVISNSRIVYLEGYLFDQPQAKAAFRKAVARANASKRTVALTLSDGFCVDRHRDEFLQLIRSGVGIVFANESEITSLYQTDSFDTAARQIADDTKLAVLTRSSHGSVIKHDGQSHTVPAERIAQLVDTTGAGDLYAAGFLFGLTQNRSLPECGHLGSLAAAEIISHVGARPAQSLAELARAKGL